MSEKYKELIDRVSDTLKRNTSYSNLIEIDYEAGAGVTTVMRMVAWHFYETIPVIILKQYSKDGTRERLRSLSKDVKRHRMLLVIDIHDFDIQLINELMRNLDVDNIPVTILFSRRHIGGRVDNYLEEQLKGNEISAFELIYNKQIDDLEISEKEKQVRKETINNIQNIESNMVTPFMYALCTFEDSFIKLSDYVREHIGNMSEIQKKFLLFISSIHYYTGMEVPMVMVEKLIANERTTTLQHVLSKNQCSILLISDTGVKTVHHSVSKELLIQTCSHGMNNEKAWKNRLVDTFTSVIEELELFKTNEKAMRILKALFLNQQPSTNKNDVVEQKHFSYAVDDLTNDVAKKKILTLLCNKFESNVNEIKEDYPSFVRKIQNSLEEVEVAYDKSIELNVGNTAAFTSKMNYLLSIIRDVQKYICPSMSVPQMIKTEKYSWCNDYIAKVQETIESIRAIDLYLNTNHEEVIKNYENQLLSLEGDLSEAINGWNNLLNKEDVYHPSIRKNLLYGYYQQCNKDWSTLQPTKCKYVRELILDNIQEQPNSANNIVQWFDFARNFESDLNKTLNYFDQYVMNPDIEYYYRAMLTYFVYGMENEDRTYIKRGMEYSNKCEEMAREKPNRRILLDVYNSKEKHLKKIEKFKKYLSKSSDYNSALALVPKVKGRIASIDKPEIGWINIEGLDTKIKFNPSYNPKRIYRSTKDEGVKVKFVLGFRAEGVFAFSVTDVECN